MGIGLGILGWSPDEFWSATLREFINAKRGWMMGQGNAPELEGHKLSPGEIVGLQRFMEKMKEED